MRLRCRVSRRSFSSVLEQEEGHETRSEGTDVRMPRDGERSARALTARDPLTSRLTRHRAGLRTDKLARRDRFRCPCPGHCFRLLVRPGLKQSTSPANGCLSCLCARRSARSRPRTSVAHIAIFASALLLDDIESDRARIATTNISRKSLTTS